MAGLLASTGRTNLVSNMDLARLLKSVGQKTFVEYYHLFADSNLSSQEVVERLPERFTLKARRSKTSHARRLFADGLEIEALEVIAASTRSGNEGTARAAQGLLSQIREAKLQSH